jgi:beta-glucosidase
MAPAYNRGDVAFHVGHNLMVAHGLAARAIRKTSPDAKVGIVLNFNIVDPKDNTQACRVAAHQRYMRAYSWYLDGLLNGAYPAEVQALLAKTPKLPGVRPYPARHGNGNWIKRGDMQLISQKLDFMGINYYTRFVVDENGHDYVTPDVARTQMGWQIYPFGLARLMDEMHRHYKMPPLYITENGAALDDTLTVTADGASVHDGQRAKFVIDHLGALSAACSAGVDVRGYFVWSLLDNLEWPLGFAKTFGIVHVDRANGLKRTVKDSGRAYARAIHRHKLRR